MGFRINNGNYIEPLEHDLDAFISVLKLLLEASATICVLISLIRTMQLAVAIRRRRNVQLPYRQLRLRFGEWLAIALEFQIQANILKTTVTSTFEALAKLSAIELIWTFLNYREFVIRLDRFAD